MPPTEAPAKPHVVVRKDRPASREFAPPRFSGERNRDSTEAEADVSTSADGPTLAADRPEGAPLVVESNQVLGGGRTRSQRPPQRMAARPTGATWMGGMGSQSGVQNQVLPDHASPTSTFEELRDPNAVATEDLITRPHVGPAPPNGEPCTCAFEWEVDEATGDIVVTPAAGIATGFRGAPKFFTWCLVCGGERDGSFRPENVEKYGPLAGELESAAPTIDPNEVVAQVMEQLAAQKMQAPTPVDVNAITEKVLASVADFMASDQFATLMASKIAAQTSARRRTAKEA